MSAIRSHSLASQEAQSEPQDFKFQRDEWVLFRSANTLPQKAGVGLPKLRRLVLKELTDNALDVGAGVDVGAIGGSPDRFFVQDDGPGIDPDQVATLFSINRPLISSKLKRMPTRGAMGNGLRVVMGSVVASGGGIEVFTRNKRLILRPQEDGSTSADVTDCDFPTGTRVEIEFGPAIPRDYHALDWAQLASAMTGGEAYSGKSSPFWYDADAFYELLQAAGGLPVRSFVADLDGCSGAKAGQIATAFKGRTCASLSRGETEDLLQSAMRSASPVAPKRLGLIGPLPARNDFDHAVERGVFSFGSRAPRASLPFVVEAWVRVDKGNDKQALEVLVNRTPITGDVRLYRDKGKLDLYGCGLSHEFQFPKSGVEIIVNVTTPYCPITTDGKEPDLSVFVSAIASTIQKAGNRARRAMPKEVAGERVTAKSVVRLNLPDAIDKASGGGLYRFNQRQLFYVVRPAVMAAVGAELSYGNFEGIITDYEAEHGDVPGMYRDPRGTLYHPHTRQTIPLGTLAVEDYERPAWTFNKVLYIEKEGPFEALKAARWPERHDCALLTSKGYTTRAVKDLLDLLADDGEAVTVFCIHDADASGTMIYQTLQEETRARPTRRAVEIINLGLDPWEAVEMGLEVEGVEKRSRADAVAQYLLDRPDGEIWRRWLQKQRVELNAMTTPEFIEWLDGKMADHEGAKVIPPVPVLVDEMRERTAAHIRRRITEEILRAARIEDQVRAEMGGIPEADGERLAASLGRWFPTNPDQIWRAYVDGLALDAAGVRS